jgi:uncharacterized protein (DUF2062 family)
MPKKLFKRFTPDAARVKRQPALKFLRPLLEDPNLFHFNRHSISLAVLVGVFVAFMPIPFQMIFAAILALWIRCNLALSIGLVWISNPLTIAPIYFATYQLGLWILDIPGMHIEPNEITFTLLQSEIGKIWKPLFLGSLVAATFFSVIFYLVTRLLWRLMIVRQWRRRKDTKLKR